MTSTYNGSEVIAFKCGFLWSTEHQPLVTYTDLIRNVCIDTFTRPQKSH